MSVEIKKIKKGSPEHTMLEEVIKDYHDELHAHGVAVALEFADISSEARSKGRHAVSVRGVPAIAKVRRTQERERRYGAPDAIITFDAQEWDDLDDRQRRAILDHECQHLEVAKDASGAAKLDKLMRPKLKLRHHDIEIGWFRAVAERHGRYSAEVEQAKAMLDSAPNLQTIFKFMSRADFPEKVARRMAESLEPAEDAGAEEPEEALAV